MIQPLRCEGPEDLDRFQERLQERADAAAELQHPKIVPIREIFQEFGLIWAVGELVRGASLPDVLSAPERFPPEKLRRVFRQVAECLDYAHERKVFHGSLKLAKIIVQDNGIVRILGFGVTGPEERTVAEDASPVPQLRYLSPEQLKGAAPDAKSDQFALAAAIYEALAGQFAGLKPPVKVGFTTLSLAPPSIETINPTLSPDTGKVLSRALSADAKDRFENCLALVSALEASLDASPEWEIPIPVKGEQEELEDQDFTPVFTEDVEPSPEKRFFGLLPVRETSEGRRWSVPTAAIWLVIAVMLTALYLGSAIWGGRSEPPRAVQLLPAAGIGIQYEQSLAAPTEKPPLSWDLVAGTVPPGLALDPETGKLRGIPETPGRFRWTLRIGDASQPTAERTFVIEVGAALAVATSPVLPGATVDNNYSYSLFSLGEGWPHRWSIKEGALPPGLSLDAMGGMIQGVPSAPGDFEFTVEVADALGATATADLRLRVDSGLAIISPSELPAAILESNYSQELVAVSGTPPYVWEIAEGTLPPGLRLEGTGIIRGRPTSRTEGRFTLRVRDSTKASAENNFSLRVRSGLTITTAPTLPAASVGSAYQQTFSVGGGRGRYSWAVASGSLPPGLSLNAQSGQLSGTPSRSGSHRFNLRVRDGANTEEVQAFTLEVRDPLLITSGDRLPGSATGAAYSATIAVRGGTAPLRFAVSSGSLPPGLALDSAAGVLSGTPRTAGSFRFAVTVSDATRASATRLFELPVDRGLTVTTVSPLRQAEVQQSYSERLDAADGNPPYSWSLAEGSLAPGLSLDPPGRIIGTPTEEGQFSFTVEATDRQGSRARKALTIRVVSALRMPTLSVLPEGSVGRVYSHSLSVSGGTPPFTWSVGPGLPAGLALDPASGMISGRPTTPGTYRFEVQVTSATRVSLTQPSEITVGPSASGELVWTGNLEADRILTIQDGQYPSVGSLDGSLPGVPVQIQLTPASVSVVTAPGPENDWKLLVISSGGQPTRRITIRWSALQ